MADETTFRNHLKQLENILSVLQNDIVNAPKDKMTSWYDDMTDTIVKTEDNIEGIIYPVNKELEDEYRDEEENDTNVIQSSIKNTDKGIYIKISANKK